MNTPIPQNSNCPTYQIIDALSKKWGLLLLKVFIDNPRELRFCELSKSLPQINSKMLSDRLTELEDLNLISRNITNTKPIKITYTINKNAQELGEIFTIFKKWVKKNSE